MVVYGSAGQRGLTFYTAHNSREASAAGLQQHSEDLTHTIPKLAEPHVNQIAAYPLKAAHLN